MERIQQNLYTKLISNWYVHDSTNSNEESLLPGFLGFFASELLENLEEGFLHNYMHSGISSIFKSSNT